MTRLKALGIAALSAVALAGCGGSDSSADPQSQLGGDRPPEWEKYGIFDSYSNWVRVQGEEPSGPPLQLILTACEAIDASYVDHKVVSTVGYFTYADVECTPDKK